MKSATRWWLILTLPLVVYWLIGLPRNFECLDGDSLCQIAYAKILFHPHLVGSIGASAAKPGQAIALGICWELTEAAGQWVLRLFLCLLGAALVWILVRISHSIGGVWAGMLTLSVALFEYAPLVRSADSNLFLLPVLFGGLWLHYNEPGRQWLGFLLLALAPLFRIESATVLVLVAIDHAIRQDWRMLRKTILCTLLSLSIWSVFLWRVQGEVARFDSNNAVGYFNPESLTGKSAPESSHTKLHSAGKLAKKAIKDYRWWLTGVGLVGSLIMAGKFTFALSPILLVFANFTLLGGALLRDRYYTVIGAFGLSVGIGFVVRYVQSNVANCTMNSRFSPVALLASGFSVIALCFGISHLDMTGRPVQSYVLEARNLAAEYNLPRGAHLMTEDDLLYPLVIADPARFAKLYALQWFNIQTESKRQQILADTDFVCVVKSSGHGYFYLNYMVNPNWISDPFRAALKQIIATGQSQAIYGYRLTPFHDDANRLILKVCANNSSSCATND